MIQRSFWLNRLTAGWSQVPIVWLSGVRRSGKTTLGESLFSDDTIYLNCDLPEVEDRVRDPQRFFQDCKKSIVIFDEVHQLTDPARILKVAADVFPHIKILATGSSTLAASKKFRDTLTGRKRTVHLTPVTWEELRAFDVGLSQRLFHGGLPPALLSSEKKAAFYREWMDSFFARDIQKLFGFRDLNRFNALLEYLLRHSGGQFEVTKAAKSLGITRPTVESHLQALQVTHAMVLVRPFYGRGVGELVKQPKVYGFDTGFVSFARGWDPLRQDDLGILWEHMVLEQLLAHFPDTPINYWRDKVGHELDFVLAHNRDEVDVIECKWDASGFDSASLKLFRASYPAGRNYLVVPSSGAAYVKHFGELEVTICNPDGVLWDRNSRRASPRHQDVDGLG